jgi:ABC-type phosphate/phosphonate transport system substrate-binding protein
VYFLQREGLDMARVQVVSLDQEFDSKGNPCSSPQHVLQALRDGRGDAGIITVGMWNRIQKDPAVAGLLKCVWTSPPFSHCVFTAAADFDRERAERFTKLMLAMDPSDPATADVMRLEGTRKWLPGSPDGFASLVQALQSQPAAR